MSTFDDLPWRALAPSAHAFDSHGLRALVAPIVESEAARGVESIDRAAVVARIRFALVNAYGAWTDGWTWANSEPGGGGLVRAWCCEDDSVLPARGRAGIEAPAATIERVCAAVLDWRAALEELEAMFDELPLSGQRAAARLLPWVIERTEASDAWYGTLDIVLTWYFEAKGVEPSRSRPLIDAATDGRFASWIAPEAFVIDDVGRALGEAVTTLERSAPAPSIDTTAAWLAVRASSSANLPEARRQPVVGDAHRVFIESRDRARDLLRADRMLAALTAARAWARTGEGLTFDVLASWQALVLGAPTAGFRTADAFANGGRDRYPLAGARERFEACLAEANDVTVPIAMRAARAYLDVCFFHPFSDGNARAARLVLDALVTRAGLGLHVAEPLFLVQRDADEERGARRFAWMLDRVLGLRA